MVKCASVNSISKSSIVPSIVVFALALALVGSPLMAEAGQSRLDSNRAAVAGATHAPIQVIPEPSTGAALRTSEGRLTSSNWSGYVLPKFATGELYTSAQATWVVPTVVFKKKPAVSSNWVGIGGFCKNSRCTSVDRTLIQLGTAHEAVNRNNSIYFAWYEMLPASSITTPLEVNPGDVITASLTCANSCTGNHQSWTLSMTNVTSGDNWSQDFNYASPNLSAEWIEEAPSGRNGIFPLANYGTTTFDESMIDGGSADLRSADTVVMRDPHGQSSNVSALNSTFDGFSACFGPHKSLTPCSFVPLP